MLAAPVMPRPAAASPCGRRQSLLARWRTEIPLYRQAAGGFITKADIRRDFPFNFLGPEADLEALVEDRLIELEHTAGTSEERTPLLLPYGWWAEQELRALRLNPLAAEVLEREPAARRVSITSPVCSGDIRYSSVPCRGDRVVGNALLVNWSRYPFLWSDADLARMAAETLDWQPRFLDVDPVYGAVFARHCERHGIKFPSLRFVLCSYEFVSTVHRRILERAFGVPVFNLYGSTETGHLLMETEAGWLRPSVQTARLDVHQPDAAGVGELIATTLTNPWMPLLGYRIGDLVESRQLGREFSYRVHGRVADAFKAPSGCWVTTWRLDQCFAGFEGIVHYQIIESGSGGWRLRFVPDGAGPEAEALAGLRRRLGGQLEGEWSFEATDLLVPEKSGKFRLGCPGRRI